MLCRKPFVQAGHAFPCGQCMPCRFNRRRMWTHRLMLERLCHKDACFVTLTYDDEHLPKGGVLVKKDLQDWLKRFRRAIEPVKIRFYGVGEYGETNGRPHYHVFLYGVSPCCEEVVRSTWNRGLVHVGTVTHDSASYIAGYTVKKMTNKDDPRLNGRPPEFCRMSLRPGIGADAMWDVASSVLWLDRDGDVPQALNHGRRNMPLGRYLRNLLRVRTGRLEGGTKEDQIARSAEMRSVWNDYEALKMEGKTSLNFSQYLSSLDDQRILNINARNLIFRKERRL
ncbi:MAG: replication initiator protein [Arizlama microvirus]|nr:MAG: replication initiator protein [Arizlama microvirus]